MTIRSRNVILHESKLSLLGLFVMMHFVLPVSILCMIFIFINKPVVQVILVINLILIIYPNKEWPSFRNAVFQLISGSVPFHIYGEKNIQELIDKNAKVLFYLEPHGIVPIGPLFFGLYINYLFPSIYPRTCVASILLRIPFFRQFYSWIGCVPANKCTIENVIKNEKRNICILPGGVAEIFTSNVDKEVLYMKKRKGFIKIASKYHLYLCPVYIFGNTQLYVHDVKPGTIIERLSRYLRSPILYFWGKGGIPFIPYNTTLTAVIGKPFRLKSHDYKQLGYEKAIEKLHKISMQKIQQIYNKYNDKLHYNKPLIII
ncbi:hypothetical protein WA158_001301 [Blastocystis sp. Blastoise]